MRLIKDKKDDRYFFTATFVRESIYSGARGITYRLIFSDIRNIKGIKIAEYIEFNNMKNFNKLNLKPGDRVSFYARIVYFRNECPNWIYPVGEKIYPRLLNPTRGKKLICPVEQLHDDQNNDYCKIKIIPTK